MCYVHCNANNKQIIVKSSNISNIADEGYSVSDLVWSIVGDVVHTNLH